MRNAQKFYTSPPGKSQGKSSKVKAPTYMSPGKGKQKVGGMKRAKSFMKTGQSTETRNNRT